MNINDLIMSVKNPYPKDVFLWDNPEKMDITRGRFNEFIYKVWENCKEEILKEIQETGVSLK